MSLRLKLVRAAVIAVALFIVLPAHAQSLSGTITLREALARALAVNPKLTAAERDLGIATGKSIQAGAIPNPEVSVEVENVAGSGPYRGTRSAETTLQLSQLIELGGKRDARLSAGLAESDSAHWQRQATRLEVVSETASAFINVLSEQRRIQVLDRQVTALDRLQPLLQRRVEAGASSQPETIRAQVAADIVRVEREKAKSELASARRELSLLMGDAAPSFAAVSGNFSDPRPLPPFSSIVAAVNGNPQLMRWNAVRAQRDAEILTARLKSVPDIRAGVGVRNFRETRDNAVVFGLSMSIPLWDQNQGDILAARESREKAEAERAVSRTALLSIAGKSYDAAAGALQELNILRTSALPNARRAAQSLEEGYGQGRFSLIDLLDVQSTLADASARELDALRRYHTAIATIEGLTGQPFTLVTGARK